MAAPIFLLSDFGLTDPYVGQMRAVLTALAPGAALVDLCHGVTPFAVRQGAFFLAASLDSLPRPSVVLAVVDPGVGSQRRLVAVDVGGIVCLAPDNGLLSLCLARRPAVAAAVLEVPADAGATFHGRDVLAPAAALASCRGFVFTSRVDPHTLARPAWASPTETPGRVRAEVLSVDRYGNLALNLDLAIWSGRLAQAPGLLLAAPQRLPVRAASHYEDLAPGELGLVAGSQGVLELALRQDSAARLLRADIGAPVTLEYAPC